MLVVSHEERRREFSKYALQNSLHRLHNFEKSHIENVLKVFGSTSSAVPYTENWWHIIFNTFVLLSITANMTQIKYFCTVLCWCLINSTKNVHYNSQNCVSNEKYKRGNPIAPRMIISGVAWRKMTRSGSGEWKLRSAQLLLLVYLWPVKKKPWQFEGNKLLHLASHIETDIIEVAVLGL